MVPSYNYILLYYIELAVASYRTMHVYMHIWHSVQEDSHFVAAKWGGPNEVNVDS